MRVGSRLQTLLFLALASGAGCRRERPAPPAVSVAAPTRSAPSAADRQVSPALPGEELTWDYPTTAAGPLRVVVSVPVRQRPDQRFPVLFVLHGMGEAQKGWQRGARGFVDDYWMPRAIERLRRPPLTSEDLLGMVSEARLQELNVALRATPYRGLVVVCPYTPTTLRGADAGEHAIVYAAFLVDEILPRVRRETPALTEARATGIDGVSLGGRGALLVGLARPDAFGVISTLQPAFDPNESEALARRAAAAVHRHPGLRFRFATSHRDYYLESTRVLASDFRATGVEASFVVLVGPHDYEFNRGPGIIELLLFHDRALRGEPAP
ncbi:MAG: esterase [Polyangiaceae bacterium]|nr:esterase [Polyangiaceae bacterium]